MSLVHVALVSQTEKIKPAQLSAASAALQKQVARDFGPLWGIQATVDAFPDLKKLPLGYWPVTVVDDINEPGAGGFHSDRNNQPFALVQWDEDWTVTASHECLEMLADPYGNKLAVGQSLDPTQGQVQYLVEVCDPCEDKQYAYAIDGVVVSDFYTPNYFDSAPARGVRYDFTGAIERPLQVLENGYVSWHDPVSNHWFQVNLILDPSGKPVDIGVLDGSAKSIRNWVDGQVRKHREGLRKGGKIGYGPHAAVGKITEKTSKAVKAVDQAQVCRGEALIDQISRMIRPHPAGNR